MTHARLRRYARRGRRRGALAVEAAVLWPALFLACLPGIEAARAFHTTALVENSARNAALCWADPRIARKLQCLDEADKSVDIQKAARIGLDEIDGLEDALTVTEFVDEDDSGAARVEITVKLKYKTLIPLGGFSIPPDPKGNEITVTRKAWMKRLPLPPFGA